MKKIIITILSILVLVSLTYAGIQLSSTDKTIDFSNSTITNRLTEMKIVSPKIKEVPTEEGEKYRIFKLYQDDGMINEDIFIKRHKRICNKYEEKTKCDYINGTRTNCRLKEVCVEYIIIEKSNPEILIDRDLQIEETLKGIAEDDIARENKVMNISLGEGEITIR